MNPKNPIPPKATIYDVATKAGVSKSLVSNVLRGEGYVSKEAKAKVLEAIKSLNYRPSRHAQQLASSKTRSIGVVITDYKNLSYVNVVSGLREVFDDAGYQVFISDVHRSPNFSDDPVDAFASMQVEGLVFITEPAALNTSSLHVPCVMIGEREELVANSDLVFSDDLMGTRLGIDHLRELGHTKIAHLTGVGGIANNRRKAYQKLMKRYGLESLIFGLAQPNTEIGGYMGAKELLQSGEKFTAIYAANDYMAAGAIAALKEAGLQVPKDVSVLGYDNAPISSNWLMKITTIDDLGIAVGRNAATIILERIGEKVRSEPRRVLLEPDLVVRSSTAKPRA